MEELTKIANEWRGSPFLEKFRKIGEVYKTKLAKGENK